MLKFYIAAPVDVLEEEDADRFSLCIDDCLVHENSRDTGGALDEFVFDVR